MPHPKLVQLHHGSYIKPQFGSQIDQQLYSMYGLDADETAYIEGQIKPME